MSHRTLLVVLEPFEKDVFALIHWMVFTILIIITKQTEITDQDFNSSSGDLGWNGQRLEKRCLLRTQASVSLWNKHIQRCNCTSFSWGCHFVCQDKISHICELFLGEDKAYIAFDVGDQPTWHKCNRMLISQQYDHHHNLGKCNRNFHTIFERSPL